MTARSAVSRRAAIGAAGGALALSATTLPAIAQAAASEPLRVKCEALVAYARNLPGSTPWMEYEVSQRYAGHLDAAMGNEFKPRECRCEEIQETLTAIDAALGGLS